MIAAVPVTGPQPPSSSDNLVVIIVFVVALSVGAFLAWKIPEWSSGKRDTPRRRDVTAYDWANTNAPTFYPTAIPTDRPTEAAVWGA